MNNLYKALSKSTTKYFISKKILPVEEKEVYEYGFEILFSSLIYTVFLITTALLTDTLLPSFVFFLGFIIFRSIAGGFHANTYITCHLLFFFNHLIFIIIYKTLPCTITINLSVLLLILSSLSLLLFAPIDHPNKRFIKNEKEKFRRLSCIYAVILLAFSILILFIPNNFLNMTSLCIAVGTSSAAIALVITKLIHLKGERKNEKD